MQDKDLEKILAELSEDVKERLKDGFDKAIIIGSKERYNSFLKFFNKKTHYYYSKKISHSEKERKTGKDIYPVMIDRYYDLRTRR